MKPSTPGPFPVDVVDNWVDYVTLGIAALALLVTVVGSALIFEQVRQTRRSVRATDDALQLARDEQRVNSELIAEARRARIDSEMPRLSVLIPERRPRMFFADRFEKDVYSSEPSPVPLPTGEAFVTPRDLDLLIGVEQRFEIRNDGPRLALVWIDSSFDPHSERNELWLDVGQTRDFMVRRVHTVREWIEFARVHLDGPTDVRPNSDVPLAWIIYAYPGDVGAIERRQIAQGGSMLIKSVESDSTWTVGELSPRVGDYPAIISGVGKFTREYFSSMERNEHL